MGKIATQVPSRFRNIGFLRRSVTVRTNFSATIASKEVFLENILMLLPLKTLLFILFTKCDPSSFLILIRRRFYQFWFSLGKFENILKRVGDGLNIFLKDLSIQICWNYQSQLTLIYKLYYFSVQKLLNLIHLNSKGHQYDKHQFCWSYNCFGGSK